MHEVSLVQGLMEQVRRLAVENEADTVIRIRVLIGPFAGVVLDSFSFAFDVLRQEDRLFRHSRLEIDAPEPVFRCLGCGGEFTFGGIGGEDRASGYFGLSAVNTGCPGCGKGDLVPLGGDEILLMQVEME